MLSALALGLGWVGASSADEILHWKRLPLAVPLLVGQERVVFIDRDVRVGVPPSVGDRLRVQSTGGAIYLRASEVIPPTRLQLQDVGSGALILIDVAAEAPTDGQPPLEPIRIANDKAMDGRPDGNKGAKTLEGNENAPADPRTSPLAVVLTRYAAQSLYAPLRTVEPLPGVTPMPLRRDLALDTLLPMLPLRARALAAWRLDDEWVTAIELTNNADRWIDLDPRALQGDFVTATFQHPNVGPSGQSTDTTVLYLVSRGHGLAGALLPSTAPIPPVASLPQPRTGQAGGGDGEE
jgi:integrating conjugative element protein (TIGR03749 family)